MVSDEVRTLAEESQRAAGSIRELIIAIQGVSADAVTVVEQEALGAFERIATGIGAVTGALEDVSAVAGSTSGAAEQVAVAAQETANSTDEIAESAAELAATAQRLDGLVRTFQI